MKRNPLAVMLVLLVTLFVTVGAVDAQVPDAILGKTA